MKELLLDTFTGHFYVTVELNVYVSFGEDRARNSYGLVSRDRYKFESFDLEKLVYLNGGGNCVVLPEDIHWVCIKKCDEITCLGEKLALDIMFRKSYFSNLSFGNYLSSI